MSRQKWLTLRWRNFLLSGASGTACEARRLRRTEVGAGSSKEGRCRQAVSARGVSAATVYRMVCSVGWLNLGGRVVPSQRVQTPSAEEACPPLHAI